MFSCTQGHVHGEQSLVFGYHGRVHIGQMVGGAYMPIDLCITKHQFLSSDFVRGMAVPLEKVSPRTFMPRHDCPPGHCTV